MRDLYDSLDFGIVLIGHDERVALCNRWMHRHARLKVTPVGQTLAQALRCEVPNRLQGAIEQALRRGHSARLSSALHPTPLPLYGSDHDTQRMRHAVDIVSVQRIDGQRGCLLQVRDMTESLRREELLRHQARQLQQSQQRLAATLDNAPIGMALSTLGGRWTYVNRALCELLGHSAEALRERSSADHVHPLDRDRHSTFESGLVNHRIVDFQVEERWMHRSGTPVWVRVTATRVDDGRHDGSQDGAHEPYLILQIESINDLKRKERQIADALAEKETLLREVYHRVKNNLQVIQSLLNLKRASLADATARAALSETAERVRAMALVHEKLYQSNQLSSIDLGEYLQDLMVQLQEALIPRSEHIEVELATAAVSADLSTAIPFGLIVTELVTNSLKHAFPANRAGRLRVSLEPMGSGARLVVADNGVGLPGSSDATSQRSLGLKLVQGLTQQLDGALAISRGDGARFELTLGRLTADSESSPDINTAVH